MTAPNYASSSVSYASKSWSAIISLRYPELADIQTPDAPPALSALFTKNAFVRAANQTSRRFIGVADIASVRFSLPAQLLEPTPNLGKSYIRAKINLETWFSLVTWLMALKSTGITLIGQRPSSGLYTTIPSKNYGLPLGQYWRFRRCAWAYASSTTLLVHKGSGKTKTPNQLDLTLNTLSEIR